MFFHRPAISHPPKPWHPPPSRPNPPAREALERSEFVQYGVRPTSKKLSKFVKLKLLACLFLCSVPQAQAVTLINNVEIIPYTDSGPPGSFTISYHGFPEALFTPISSSAYLFSFLGIAEEFAFYNVSLGDLIDPGYTERTARLISNTGNPGTANFDIAMNESKYLGYWADALNYYGWVRVSRTPTGLVASESATSVGNGIHVGSFTEVPEPSVSVLGLLAIAPLLRRSRTTIIGHSPDDNGC